jgi:2-hydroxychromene-2-carboxylate isomerase
MTQIDYFFTLNSPWSYMGGERLMKMAKEHGANVNTKPAQMGVVFAQTGGLPLPKRAPARQAYRLVDMKRWVEFLEIPFVREPEFFPHDETEGVRLVLAAVETGGDALALATEIGRSLWELNEDPADADVQSAAAARAGLDADALRGALSLEDAATIWSKNTDEALDRGVFGAPSYIIDGEIFWGQDRLDFVERKLANS